MQRGSFNRHRVVLIAGGAAILSAIQVITAAGLIGRGKAGDLYNVGDADVILARGDVESVFAFPYRYPSRDSLRMLCVDIEAQLTGSEAQAAEVKCLRTALHRDGDDTALRIHRDAPGGADVLERILDFRVKRRYRGVAAVFIE